MTFLNLWALFALLPLWLLYRRQAKNTTKQIRLLFLTLFFMIIALARPALQNEPTKRSFYSQDFIIALDASYSMMADDIKPTRFLAAKKAIKKLLRLHPKDRFTLFLFTSNALLVSPPTTDTEIAYNALDALNPEYILTKSTSLENLFLSLAKVSNAPKKLILFTDGGEESDITKLVAVLKNAHITPYIVATATHKGAPLRKDGGYLKNDSGMLVVSRINPALEEIAALTKGKYYELSTLDVVNELSNDITDTSKKKRNEFEVRGYTELYSYFLFVATVLFFLATTKFHQALPLLSLMLLPYAAKAGVLDFHYLDKANSAIEAKNYEKALSYYAKITQTPQSRYNSANLYYRLGKYRDALRLYASIKTPNRKLKAAIFFNMGNCAAKMEKYDIARRYYRYTLALTPNDKQALENLHTLQRLHLHDQRTKRPKLQQRGDAKRQNRQTNSNTNTKNKNKNSSSNRSASQSAGGGGAKKSKQQNGTVVHTRNKNNNFRFGYKAYELINKGYADEKRPW